MLSASADTIKSVYRLKGKIELLPLKEVELLLSAARAENASGRAFRQLHRKRGQRLGFCGLRFLQRLPFGK